MIEVLWNASRAEEWDITKAIVETSMAQDQQEEQPRGRGGGIMQIYRILKPE